MALEAIDPFLFFRRRSDWRWVSFAEVGERITTGRRALPHLPSGARVAVAPGPSLDALLADLAVRAAGLVSVPLAADTGDPAGLEAAEVVAVFDPRAASVTAARPPGGGGRLGGERPAIARVGSGGCLVRKDQPVGWAELGSAELAARVEAVGELIGDLESRPIVVHAVSLAEEWERIVIEWAIGEAAAIVIASDPDQALGALYWARPTIVHGTATRLAEWTRALAGVERGRRARRRRLARVRCLLVGGKGGLDDRTAGFWRTLGVPVLALPEAPPGRGDRLS